MAMDLSRMSSLTDPERWLVASDLQAMFLDEVYVQTGWSGRDGVFHGGTALHLAWNSPRYSEDLDFMVVEDRLARLAELAPRIVDGVRMRILEGLPGSVVEFKARDRTFEGERVVTWDVRWKHENRQGKVQIKLEFLAAHPERLADYASFKEMRLPGLDRVALRAEIAVPEKVSFWGDKVKAFATRPEVKWRDVFDLGFLSRQFERDRARPSPEELGHALEVSARIYNREASSLADGLRLRLGDGTFDSSAEYISAMAQWFDPGTYRNLASNGTLEELFGRARAEVECGLELALQAGTPSMRMGCR